MMFGVTLRNREYDIEVTSDGGYEPDTGAWEIEWHFVDKPPFELTDDEDELVGIQIYETLNDAYE